MTEAYNDWKLAHTAAQADANRFHRPMGIEKAKEYGRTVYRVAMLPIKPSDRYGWETRCEVVEPEG